MFDLTYKSDHARRELAPHRALLTPAWIAALALLVANDHWLKGSGLLPELLTGKLSDFAGMLVAPVLLATLVRARTRRALLLCHLAVAGVFAGIQLSPSFAAQWSALMGLFGHPWAITCDPWDLVALPFLLLSWALLVPEMDPRKPALVPLQRTAVATLSVFGLWATVATSDDGGIDPDGEWYQDVYGHVFVNNANDFTISLHIRPLRSDVVLDCSEIATDPGRLLARDAFGEAQHWELPERTNVGIEFVAANNCGAAWIAGEGIPPTIVFADRNLYPPQWYPGQIFDAGDLGRGGVAVVFDDDGGSWVGNEELRFTPRTDAPEQPASCEAASGETRFDWPLTLPTRAVEVLAVEAGVDGCFELELQELGLLDGEVQPVGEPYPFYLCVPEAAMPFAAGERLDLQETYGNNGERELAVVLLEPETLAVAVDDNGRVLRQARYLRGGNDPQFIGPAIGRDLVAVSKPSCPWQVEAGCAEVERTVDIGVSGADSFLEPGAPVSFADQPSPSAQVRTAVLGYARQRALVDQSCSEGALQLRYDIDFAVIEEPLI